MLTNRNSDYLKLTIKTSKKMKSSTKKKLKFLNFVCGKDPKLTSEEKFKIKKYKPRVFNKRRNPISFVVDWQLNDTQV